MNGGAFAPGLLFASLGLALAFSASKRIMATGLAAITAVAALVVVLAPRFPDQIPGLAGCWISVLAAAACMYSPQPIGVQATLSLCANGGLWAGLTIAGTGEPVGLATSLPWLLSCLPAAWLVERGHGIVVKVGGGWLAAAAVLSLGLLTVPTLGFEPDHRE